MQQRTNSRVIQQKNAATLKNFWNYFSELKFPDTLHLRSPIQTIDSQNIYYHACLRLVLFGTDHWGFREATLDIGDEVRRASSGPYHWHFGHNDVHLTSQFLQGVHQLIRIAMNSNPTSIHEDLRCTERKSSQWRTVSHQVMTETCHFFINGYLLFPDIQCNLLWDCRRWNFFEILHTPLFQELEDRRRLGTDRNVGHEGQVFHQSHSLTLLQRKRQLFAGPNYKPLSLCQGLFRHLVEKR